MLLLFLTCLNKNLYLKCNTNDDIDNTVKPRYNAGRGRKNFEAKNRVIHL